MRLFLSFLLLLVLTTYSYSQQVKLVEEKTAFSEKVKTGEINLELPASITAEEVEKSASYYTDYFSVNFDEDTRVITITMKNNSPKKRRVIMRFLYSCGMKTVDVGSEEISIHDFYDNYLK